jgi:hypothetical protein
MSLSRRFVELALAVALAANLAGAAVTAPASPEPEIDQVGWKDTNAWACAKTIAILLPKVAGEFKGPQPVDAYTRRFAEGLAAGLRQRVGEGSVTVVSTTDAVTADLVITGEFVTLTGGSRAQRFWVGFGAGKSWADLRLHCTRRETGLPVFSLRQERGSAMGLKKDEIMENVEEITQDVVAYLGSRSYACDPAAWDRTTIAPIGTTPLEEFQLKVGSHKIEIRKAGFQSWSRTFALREGPTTRLDVKLEAEKHGAADRPNR